MQLKDKIYEAFSCEKEVQVQSAALEIDSVILSNPLKIKLEDFTAPSIAKDELNFLKDILNSPVRI